MPYQVLHRGLHGCLLFDWIKWNVLLYERRGLVGRRVQCQNGRLTTWNKKEKKKGIEEGKKGNYTTKKKKKWLLLLLREKKKDGDYIKKVYKPNEGYKQPKSDIHYSTAVLCIVGVGDAYVVQIR